MTQINAYLAFKGNCREAMTFYKDCIGGELTMTTIGESTIASQMPKEAANNVLHSSLTKGPLLLLASDMAVPEALITGNCISLCMNCSSEEEINTCFSKLSQGGQILDPLSVKFWGAIFGVLMDKFGLRWMLVYDKNIKQ